MVIYSFQKHFWFNFEWFFVLILTEYDMYYMEKILGLEELIRG